VFALYMYSVNLFKSGTIYHRQKVRLWNVCH
jgi:hypothetical protein